MIWSAMIPGDAPAWYKLKVIAGEEAESIALVMEVSQSAQAFLLSQLRGMKPILESIERAFEVPKFIFPRRQGGWGFGEVLTLEREVESGLLTWRCEFPRGVAGDWPKLWAIGLTLEILFNQLRFFEISKDYRYYLPQLLVVELGLREKQTQQMRVHLSPALCQWIAEHPNQTTADYISRSMKIAYNLLGLDENREFKVQIFNTQSLNLWIPGEKACCLEAEEPFGASSISDGITLVDHNVDNPIETLTLLAGVFALYEKANQGVRINGGRAQILDVYRRGKLSVAHQMGLGNTVFYDRDSGPFLVVDGKLDLLILRSLLAIK